MLLLSTLFLSIPQFSVKNLIFWFITESCGIDGNEVDKGSMKGF